MASTVHFFGSRPRKVKLPLATQLCLWWLPASQQREDEIERITKRIEKTKSDQARFESMTFSLHGLKRAVLRASAGFPFNSSFIYGEAERSATGG